MLTFDSGIELTGDLTTLGIAYTNIDPNGTLTASLFDATKYSAIIVASVSSCGGCDNSDAGLADLAAQSTAIASFFNAGGGILDLSGADNLKAYAYVPQGAASIGGSPPASGFVEAAAGTALDLLAENGDPTHNDFGTSGVGGLSAAYVVAELNGTSNESFPLQNGAITCVGEACTIGDGGGAGNVRFVRSRPGHGPGGEPARLSLDVESGATCAASSCASPPAVRTARGWADAAFHKVMPATAFRSSAADGPSASGSDASLR